MARVITFSTKFPAYHPKAGQPTYFVEKIWATLVDHLGFSEPKYFLKDYPHLTDIMMNPEVYKPAPKLHTIRRGERWKAGDHFSPRVWSGKPYVSKMLTIAPDIKIQRTVPFEMDLNGVYSIDGKYIWDEIGPVLAKNDGLTEDEMFQWLMPDYNKPVAFKGQILILADHNLPY